MTTKEQEKQALLKIRKIVDGLGEDSYIGTAMEGVWEVAEQNIELDAAFSLAGQKRALERELESRDQRIVELDGKVGKQRGEMEVLYKSMAEAQRLVRKWHITKEIYDEMVRIVQERKELEERQMKEAADSWADSIDADGGTLAESKQQAEAYRQHREQWRICCDILLVLGKYGE